MPVATYSISILGRGGGRSAVKQSAYGSGKTLRVSSALAASSYRSGEKLRDEQLGQTFDYTGREDVVHTEILAPQHAPDWASNREMLWNTVEAAEKRKDAQLARSLIIGLPRELSMEQNIDLVRQHVWEQFVARGMIADIAIHEKEAADGQRNPHAHVLLTLRDVTANGFGNKNRDWNHPTLAEAWRDAWGQRQNAYLEAAGSDARVDMRSYERQGREQLPTEHLGYEANELEKQGTPTAVGDQNRAIEQENARRAEAANKAVNPPGKAAQGAPAASNDNQQQAAKDRPHTPADAIKRRDSERQQQREAQWRWMKDALDGWQRYWDKQTERVQQGYAYVASKLDTDTLKAWFARGAKPGPTQDRPEAEYQQKPQRVWSQEQRDDYRMLQPYLQQHADLTTRERAHATAVHMQYVQQQREQERRAVMQNIAQRQAKSRYRSIEQDRPLPGQERERTRARGR
jgi:hypothetical protein